MNSSQLVVAIVGGGPKALAIAAKAHVLRQLGRGDINVVIYDRNKLANNWDGRGGFTDGEQFLGTSPEKDVGFPYQSSFGSDVDLRMLWYSWQAFKLVDSEETYADWVDRGRPQPRHKDWARYLQWVGARSEPIFVNDEVIKIEAADGGCVVTSRDQGSRMVSGVVITGPGDSKRIPGANPNGRTVFDGRDYWLHKAEFASLSGARIAVLGAGESAASVVSSVLSGDAEQRKIRVEAITRHGTLFTRGESFHENRVFSNPHAWHELDDLDREEFIRRTDRGVFSVAAQRIIEGAMGPFRVITGNVTKVEESEGKVYVHLVRQNQAITYSYDRLIVATGFDPLSPLRTLMPESYPLDYEMAHVRNNVDFHLRVAASGGELVHVHAPMLAGFKQGPGIPNLSCLGIVSDRILSAYVGI